MHHPLGVFEHFLLPEFEEVVRISVKFKAIFTVLPVERKVNKKLDYAQQRIFLSIDA